MNSRTSMQPPPLVNDGLMNLATIAGQQQGGSHHGSLSNTSARHVHPTSSPHHLSASPSIYAGSQQPPGALSGAPPQPQPPQMSPQNPSSGSFPSGGGTTAAIPAPVDGIASETPTKTDQGLFQCGYCKKNYNRADHLIRHVRSHTREKPYVCDVCHKGFARPDLVKRHAAGHELEPDGKRRRTALPSAAGRVTQACKACAGSKLKCAEEKPCRRCRTKGLTCEFTTAEGETVSINTVEQEQEQGEGEKDSDGVEEAGDIQDGDAKEQYLPQIDPAFVMMQNGSMQQDFQDERRVSMMQTTQQMSPGQYGQPDPKYMMNVAMTDPRYQTHPQMQPVDQLPTPETMVPHAVVTSFLDEGPGVVQFDGTYFPNFLRDMTTPASLDMFNSLDPWQFFHNDYDSRGPLDPSAGSQFDRSESDFGFLDIFNDTRSVPDPSLDRRMPEGDFEKRTNVAIGSEAFKRSSMTDWTPTMQDHGYTDVDSLALPNAGEETGARLDFKRQLVDERLSNASRDKIFGMVVEMCRRSSRTRMMSSFPSVEVLDSLVQGYFETEAAQVHSWVHAPTFKMSTARPELLTVFAAMSASRHSHPPIRKLGMALMEVVRLVLPVRFEESNAMTRDLETLQAYQLCLQIGLWSGNGRRQEIAESFQLPGITMLRRGRRFRRSAYQSIVPEPGDEGEALQKKWRDWAQQESFKRMVYRVFVHDGQVSVFLNINRSISYAEMALPLPEARDLWDAKTAEQWKELYLTKLGLCSDRIPSLAEAMQDMYRISMSAPRLDTQFCCIIILHGLSALVWEHHRMKSMIGSHSRHWSPIVLQNRHDELVATLQHFRMQSSEWLPSPEVQLMQELFSMHLYVSLEELQIFAGKEDKEEARRVYYSACDWIESSASRQAVWHAGQVLRAARAMKKNRLYDFYALAVYHASLCFWSYSIISRARDSEKGGQMDQAYGGNNNGNVTLPNNVNRGDQNLIYLDAIDSPDLPRFIALKKGIPALHNSTVPANSNSRSPANHNTNPSSVVLLDDPPAVMKTMATVLRSNHGNKDARSLPPLVQILTQLMRDLGVAAGNGNGHGASGKGNQGDGN